MHAKINLNVNEAIPTFSLGTLHITADGSHYRYMKSDGSAISAANLVYTIDQDLWQLDAALTTTVAASGEIHPLCVNHVAMTANYYGWFFVGPGEHTFTSVAAITAQAKIYTSATAGKIDDDSSGEILIPGLVAYDAFASAVTGTCYASVPLYVSN